MRTRMVRTMGIPLLAGSMALSPLVMAVQGLYSMDELLDAEVYDNAGEEVGEVENVLLGDDMSVHSLVIRTGDILGLGGRDVVAERGSFTVRPEQDDADDDDGEFDDVDYDVHMEGDQNSVKDLPEYDESWWNQTREGLQQAWENTKDTSENAWENTKEATSSAWQNVQEGAEELGDNAEDATN